MSESLGPTAEGPLWKRSVLPLVFRSWRACSVFLQPQHFSQPLMPASFDKLHATAQSGSWATLELQPPYSGTAQKAAKQLLSKQKECQKAELRSTCSAQTQNLIKLLSMGSLTRTRQ